MQNTLPINKKEELIYTFFMVIVMSSGMTFFNTSFHNGVNIDSVVKSWIMLPVVALIAFLIEWFLVGKSAHYLINKYIKREDHVAKKVLLSSFFFVIQMVVIMTCVCAALFNSGSEHFWADLFTTLPRNFAMAFLLKVIVAGPLVGLVFRKLFPIGVVVYDK